jgi:hypothetical protein
MPLFIVLIAWSALNVVATRRLLLLGDRIRMPGMQVALVWIAPFIGACMALLATTAAFRQLREESAVPPPRVHEAAPEEVPADGVPAFPMRQSLRAVNGYPMLDWGAAAAWLATVAEGAARAAARVDLHRAWLEHLRGHFGEAFWLYESDDAMILSSLEPEIAAAMSRYVTTSRKRIVQTLGALARFPQGLKSVVLVVDDEDEYYQYISMFGSAEGELALSGGCFIDMGCPHFVVRRAELNAVEPVIAHELTHSALAHLRLPLWIDEGLAVNTEHRIAGSHRGAYTPQELHAKHIEFWNDETIQQFWTGRAFRRADDGNMLSYDLARILVAQMGRAWPSFERFAQEATRDDAGARSARANLALDLGAYVSLMFEREPSPAWQPSVQAEAPSLSAPASD